MPSLSLGPVNMRFRDKPFYEPFPELRSEDDEAAGGAAAEGGANPETGERVQSMEEIMQELGLEEMLDEEDDEDDEDDEVVGPMGRAPAMPGMGDDDEDEEEEDDEDDEVGPMGRAPALVMPPAAEEEPDGAPAP